MYAIRAARLIPSSDPARPDPTAERKNIGRSLVNYIASEVERLYSRIARPAVNGRRSILDQRDGITARLVYSANTAKCVIPGVKYTRRVLLNREMSCAQNDTTRVSCETTLGMKRRLFSFLLRTRSQCYRD